MIFLNLVYKVNYFAISSQQNKILFYLHGFINVLLISPVFKTRLLWEFFAFHEKLVLKVAHSFTYKRKEGNLLKRFKEWANVNSWWLPWVGVTATIFGLIFPDVLLKTGQALTKFLQVMLAYWIQVLIVVWVIYIQIEIQRMKKKKKYP